MNILLQKIDSQALIVKTKHYKILNHSYILNQTDHVLGKETILKVSSVSPQRFLSFYDHKIKIVATRRVQLVSTKYYT